MKTHDERGAMTVGDLKTLLETLRIPDDAGIRVRSTGTRRIKGDAFDGIVVDRSVANDGQTIVLDIERTSQT